MSIFDDVASKITGKPPAEEGPTTEEKVDFSMKQDMIDIAKQQEQPSSLNSTEFKERAYMPTTFNDSPAHALLIKEISLANLQSEEDEDYFSLCMQVIILADQMGITEVRDQLHAQMEDELMLTRARKGKQLELTHSEGQRIEKTVTEKHGERW